MVGIEVIDERGGRVATVIVIAMTGTDVVRETNWMNPLMISTKNHQRGSKQTTT